MFKKAGTITLIFDELGERAVSFKAGETVLEAALRQKLPLDFSCTEGTCGSCRVSVVTAPADLEPPHEVELETKTERGFTVDERLACQMNACDGFKARVPRYK